jgi:hypothetical protein
MFLLIIQHCKNLEINLELKLTLDRKIITWCGALYVIRRAFTLVLSFRSVAQEVFLFGHEYNK